jgi:RNA polymerase sigma-70 factor (ECF subfamily)
LAEKQLVAAARRGDAAATVELLRRAAAPAWRWSRGFCRDPEDAADLAQDVLLTLHHALPRFRGDASLSTWTYIVARRACARRQRRARRQASLDAPAQAHLRDRPDPGAGPVSRFEHRRLAERLEDAVAALPETQRAVLVMRDVEGLSAREVGTVLALGERAVKSRLHRARLALRERLAPFVTETDVTAPTPACLETAHLLSRQLEGELAPGACARMEEHVRQCPHCEARCRELRRVLAACRDYGAQPVPEELERAVRDAVRGLHAAPVAGTRASIKARPRPKRARVALANGP